MQGIPLMTTFLQILLPLYEPQSRANYAQLCATRCLCRHFTDDAPECGTQREGHLFSKPVRRIMSIGLEACQRGSGRVLPPAGQHSNLIPDSLPVDKRRAMGTMKTTEAVRSETTEALRSETTEAVRSETTESVRPETTEAVPPETTEAGRPEMTEEVPPETTEAVPPETTEALLPRHHILVRVSHWLIVLSFLALLVTGVEILTCHPRFYWGESGNLNMHPAFIVPIPSSRGAVPTGYSFVLSDQNGWGRYLHFEAAWILVLTSLLYGAFGFFRGHFRQNLVPAPSDLRPKKLGNEIVRHLRFERPSEDEAWSYNALQRMTYLVVVFVLFPMMIWTGLSMTLAFASVFPSAVRILGGHQSARTLHFFVCILLVLFLLIHLLMIYLAGVRKRVGPMITGRVSQRKEQVWAKFQGVNS